MSAGKTICFAGWDAQTQQPSVAEISDSRITRVARRLGRKPPAAARVKTRDAPVFGDKSNPSVGKWAIVALESDMERAKESLAPLIEHRLSQGIAVTWVPSANLSPGIAAIHPPPAKAAYSKWIARLNETTDNQTPYYLLLIGGPDRIPFEVQIEMDNYFGTGRLDVSDTPGGAFSWEACRAYAEKIVQFEQGLLPVQRKALLYSFTTDDATGAAHREVSEPLSKYLVDLLGPGAINTLFEKNATTPKLLSELGSGVSDSPALIVTVSHGIERPSDPVLWGALTDSTFVKQAGGTPFSAHSVSKEPFAPGAVILSFACFSAGVPQRSAHRLLLGEGDEYLPFAPRTADLPRTLLAHPQGPIAFAGHVDRATSYSFQALGAADGQNAFIHFAAWILGKLSDTDLARGTLSRALSTFRERAGQRARELVALSSPAGRKGSSPAALVDAWVKCHDAEGYILLGDPVIRMAKVMGKGDLPG